MYTLFKILHYILYTTMNIRCVHIEVYLGDARHQSVVRAHNPKYWNFFSRLSPTSSNQQQQPAAATAILVPDQIQLVSFTSDCNIPPLHSDRR